MARCTQHESTVYQRRVSSEGSSSKKPALMRANFLMKLNVSFAMKPCLSNARARKSNGCSRCPVFRSNTGCSEFLRLAHSSATLPALFSQPRYVFENWLTRARRRSRGHAHRGCCTSPRLLHSLSSYGAKRLPWLLNRRLRQEFPHFPP